ncbi:MAG: hypothetical protein A2V77_17540 [Anaeromyxobacter sp. RBG_16_69_14]|nr:MAG: hypothetical protein A2V77_17540 [Anaeromyxobacter sp. RBG_16_69_14]
MFGFHGHEPRSDEAARGCKGPRNVRARVGDREGHEVVAGRFASAGEVRDDVLERAMGMNGEHELEDGQFRRLESERCRQDAEVPADRRRRYGHAQQLPSGLSEEGTNRCGLLASPLLRPGPDRVETDRPRREGRNADRVVLVGEPCPHALGHE